MAQVVIESSLFHFYFVPNTLSRSFKLFFFLLLFNLCVIADVKGLENEKNSYLSVDMD